MGGRWGHWRVNGGWHLRRLVGQDGAGARSDGTGGADVHGTLDLTAGLEEAVRDGWSVRRFQYCIDARGSV